MKQENFSLINKTKGKLPSLPFVQIKDDILGQNYSLSIAYVTESVSRNLNKTYRNKDRSTNVLSFNLSKHEGELVLCPAVIRREAKNFDRTFEKFLGFLVIHGMLHLKGMDHSVTMEKRELKYDKKYFSRNRFGLGDNASHSGRIYRRRKNS
jgi:rRNA maturation RNase YbeY